MLTSKARPGVASNLLAVNTMAAASCPVHARALLAAACLSPLSCNRESASQLASCCMASDRIILLYFKHAAQKQSRSHLFLFNVCPPPLFSADGVVISMNILLCH